MRISRREKVKDEEIKQQMGIESSIMDDIESKQLVWYMCKEWTEIDSRNK